MTTTSRVGFGVYAVLLMPALVGLPLRQELPFYTAALAEIIVAVVVAVHILTAFIRQASGRRAKAWVALSTIATACVALLQLMAFAALIGVDTPGVRFVSNLVRLDPEIIQGTLVVLLAAFTTMLGLTWPLVALDADRVSLRICHYEDAPKHHGSTHGLARPRSGESRRVSGTSGPERNAHPPGKSSKIPTGGGNERHGQQPGYVAHAHTPEKHNGWTGFLRMSALAIAVAIPAAGLALAFAPNAHAPSTCQIKAADIAPRSAESTSLAPELAAPSPRSSSADVIAQSPDRPRGTGRTRTPRTGQRAPPSAQP
jgi:hypothetical protein